MGQIPHQIHEKAKFLNYTKVKLFSFIPNHINIKNKHCEKTLFLELQ